MLLARLIVLLLSQLMLAQHLESLPINAIAYLSDYGYFANEMNDQAAIGDALISLQEAFGLRQTGVLDDETLSLMALPRCSVPDNPTMATAIKRKSNDSGNEKATIDDEDDDDYDDIILQYDDDDNDDDDDDYSGDEFEYEDFGFSDGYGIDYDEDDDVGPTVNEGSDDSDEGSTEDFVAYSRFWKQPDLRWTIRLNHLIPNIANVDRETRKAFAFWQQQTGFQFHESDESHAANINIMFVRGNHGDGLPFDGNGNKLAHAFLPYSKRRGEMHFDSDEVWSFLNTSVLNTFDYYTVAIHEIGHILGLRHTRDNSSLMYPIYKFYDKSQRLSYEDLKLLKLYYPKFMSHIKPSQKLSLHESRFDTTAIVYGKLFVFKRDRVWIYRSNSTAVVSPSFPIRRLFSFPSATKFTRIQHVHQYRETGNIAIILNSEYYLFIGKSLLRGYPKRINGLDADTVVLCIVSVDNSTYITTGSRKPIIELDAFGERIL